jgi:GH24 family phage-related lysozyme (muramidase)
MMMMTLRKQIERDEGKRNRGYKCPAGYWTIGVGYNVENGPPLPDAIIDQITDYLIEYFTLELVDVLSKMVGTMTQHRIFWIVSTLAKLGIGPSVWPSNCKRG